MPDANGKPNGSVGVPAEEVARVDEMRALTSVILERYMFMRQHGLSHGGERDFYEVFGYDRILTNRLYREMYQRGGIAGRVVDAYPNATWRGSMELVEDLDPHNDTPFEKAWRDLDARLQIQAKFHRVDKLSQLSNYAVLLIGAPGDLATELPKGKPESLLYLSAFAGGGGPGADSTARSAAIDADCTIQDIDIDSNSERFGLPQTYMLKRADLSGVTGFQRPVHWTRIVHVAENCLFDEVYGQPALERIYNLLLDLEKVTGGGAEAFWLRANQGLHLNVNKDMSPDAAKLAVESLKEQSEEYRHQLTRWLRTRGVDVQTLGSDVANFASPADAILTQIAGAKAIPKRILTGSEMGELASSQDRDNWKDQINGRQAQHAGPYIVRPFVDRLVKYGYLPEPAGGPMAYEVRWPHIQTLTEAEKAEGAQRWANTNATQGSPVFTGAEIREKWYQLDPLTDEEIEAEVEAKKAAEPEPEPEPEIPAGPPGGGESESVEVEEETPEPKAAQHGVDYKFSSTQVQLPPRLAGALFEFGGKIPDEDLAEDGREDDAHITVKYGLHTNDVNEVRRALADFIGPVRLTLGETDFFEADEYDVVYVKVDSPDLRRLNAHVAAALDVTDTYPRYVPHATIAYVKSGLGRRYAGNTSLKGMTATVTTVLFSPADDGDDAIIQLPLRAAQNHAQRQDRVQGQERAQSQERAQNVDSELLQVLEAAVEANNLDVIDAILGTDHGPRDLGGPGSGYHGHSGGPGGAGHPGGSTPRLNGTRSNPSDSIDVETAEAGGTWNVTHFRDASKDVRFTKEPLFTDDRHAYFAPDAEFDDHNLDGIPGTMVFGELTLEHPKVLPSNESYEIGYKPAEIARLKAEGYDGIVNENGQEMIAFYPARQLRETERRVDSYLQRRALGGPGSGHFGHAGRKGLGPGGSLPGKGGAFQNQRAVAPGPLDRIRTPGEGFTYSVTRGDEPKTGCVVSLHKDREREIDVQDATVDTLAEYVRDNADLLTKSGNYLGAWHDPDTGKIVLDVSTVVESGEEANRLGFQSFQKSYYDIDQGKVVEIRPPPATVAEPERRAAEEYDEDQDRTDQDRTPDRTKRRAANRRGFGRALEETARPRPDARGDRAHESHPGTDTGFVDTQSVVDTRSLRSFFRSLANLIPRSLGGPGSGHFGHAGRPGDVGGSTSLVARIKQPSGYEFDIRLTKKTDTKFDVHRREVGTEDWKPATTVELLSANRTKGLGQLNGPEADAVLSLLAKLDPNRLRGYEGRTRLLGGPGSGHFGHAGRRGAGPGGSLPGKGSATQDARSQDARVISTPLGAELSAKTWLHGTDDVLEPGKIRDPLFLTTSAEGADWYTNRGSRRGGDAIYPVKIDVKNPLQIVNYEDAVRLRDILTDAGLSVTLTPAHTEIINGRTVKVGWDWQADFVEVDSPYEGSNPVDVVYSPKARRALLDAGYDAVYTFDPVATPSGGDFDEVETVVPLDAKRQVRSTITKRALGGPGSGHHGHAGRPGAVGGSAPVGGGMGPRVAGPGAVAFTNHLARLPGALEASAAKQITIANTDAEAAEKIDDYLLKHYGFDLQGQAASIVDRDRGVIISTQREAPAAAARTMTPRFMSPEWIAASRKRMGLPPEESFVDAFSALFTEGQPLFEVARHEDPLVFPLEAAVDVFKQWGWL